MITWKRLALLAAFAFLALPEARAQLPSIETASARQIQVDIRSSNSDVTVVNFWATWCIPCREEMPAFVRLGREFGSERVRVLFVSADFPENVPEARHFLAEHGVTNSSYLKVGDDQEFINAFNPDWSGALPATAVYGRGGELMDFWEGKTSFENLAERVIWALDALQTNPTNEEQRP